jgi:hypothetical protein
MADGRRFPVLDAMVRHAQGDFRIDRPLAGDKVRLAPRISRDRPPTGTSSMIYELRIYTAVTGRLPDVVKRFDTITLGMWEKHGIKQAGFWTTLVGPSSNDLIYLLAWESMADRETKWNAFATDPAWLAAKAETEKNGPIVQTIANSFLQPTSFSSVK